MSSTLAPKRTATESHSPASSQLEAMITPTSLLNSSLDVDQVRQRAIDAARSLLGCEASSLLLVDNKTGGLYFDAAIGSRGNKVKPMHLAPGEGIAGWVAEHRQPIIITDAQSDPRLYRQADKHSGFKTRNMLCVPVTRKDTLIGVLQAINKRHGTFSEIDLQLLGTLAHQIGIALENSRLYVELKESLHSVITVLAEAIEKRDPFAAGHAKRVANYSVSIGKALGLSKKSLSNLKVAALLHDIGMLGLPDRLQKSPDQMRSKERAKMMTHIYIGCDILKDVKHLQPILPAIRYHHEHYDGSGPHRLAGSDIPLAARIIAVADSFDGMTHDRPYHACVGYHRAVDELQQQAGRLFDPMVVDAFVNGQAIKLARRFFEV